MHGCVRRGCARVAPHRAHVRHSVNSWTPPGTYLVPDSCSAVDVVRLGMDCQQAAQRCGKVVAIPCQQIVASPWPDCSLGVDQFGQLPITQRRRADTHGLLQRNARGKRCRIPATQRTRKSSFAA